MLTTLRVRDFAIAAEVALEFGPGLNVITGETGAGKSLVVDALGLLLGGRAHERVVRAGADQAELEALFEAVTDAEAVAALAERGLASEDGSVIVRRVVGRQGKGRAWLNGRIATAADLRAVAGPLVNLSTQHEQNRLLDRRHHRDVLDRVAGLGPARAACAAAHRAWAEARAAADELERALAQAQERRDYLTFCADEIDDVAPRPGETAGLEVEIRRLRAGESLLRLSAQTQEALQGDGGARERLAGLPRDLERARRDDPALADFGGRIQEILALIDELAGDIERYADGVGRDPARMATAEARFDRLVSAARKYGGSEEAMIARRQAIAVELQGETDGAERLAALRRGLPALRARLDEAANALSAGRRQAAEGLGASVGEVLAGLGMERAVFAVAIERVAGDPGPDGADRVQFLLQSNAGEVAAPLDAVASGGELSRVLLGLQRAAAAHAAVATAVYDEVDAGLSGSTGLALGRFLVELAGQQQLLVVSHLPQVAAAADRHLHVRKREEQGRTVSEVEDLDEEGRLRELARMLGAADVTSHTAREHAAALRASQRRG